MLDYEIFFRFFNRFKAQRFKDIDPNDPLILEMNTKLVKTGQFFHIGDYIELNMLYLCGNCHKYFGVACENMSPATYFQKTHPNDMKRHALGRSKVFQIVAEMFHDKSDDFILSTHFKTKDNTGGYKDLLYQMYMIYAEVPYPTVYALQVNTDITNMIAGQKGYHYYLGKDRSFFRYPDKELLMNGNIFSKREFDIIKGIAKGLESHEIAEELFISVHTVNTHRRNILNKTGKRNTHELVHELQDRGVI
jgi:DNA-binding CsgD family transcriptional regulator